MRAPRRAAPAPTCASPGVAIGDAGAEVADVGLDIRDAGADFSDAETRVPDVCADFRRGLLRIVERGAALLYCAQAQ
jgi:hypothetical protein